MQRQGFREGETGWKVSTVANARITFGILKVLQEFLIQSLTNLPPVPAALLNTSTGALPKVFVKRPYPLRVQAKSTEYAYGEGL